MTLQCRHLLAAGVCLAVASFLNVSSLRAEPTVIAPLIEGQARCEAAYNAPALNDDQATSLCERLDKNGASGIAKVLDALGPKRSPSGRFELGYTLIIPLLSYYKPTASGWALDQHAIDLTLSDITDIDRPVVLHLSATHFNFQGQAFAAKLAEDPRNLMWTKTGPLVSDSYFNTPIHAWTIADDNAPINVYRREAFKDVLDTVCRLPAKVRDRIVAVSFLGETHQLFPDLQGTGASYQSKYVTTDYSPASKAAFRLWLKTRFGTVDKLNRYLGSHFDAFEAILPPQDDLKDQPAADRLRHLDENAAGSVAIFGWAASHELQPTISVYVDGAFAGQTIADLSRLDVLDAQPDLGARNVGFRYDLDYRKLPPGTHTVDLLASSSTTVPYRLGERQIVVLGDASTRPASQIHVLPETRALDTRLSGFIDHPASMTRVLYNPLAELWDQFRFSQVTRFQEQFSKIAANSCFSHSALFSHQIAPILYPEYNPEKIGVEDSLKYNPNYNLGITMYGGSAFGGQFFRWKTAQGWKRYGIGEFNPLVKLSPPQYRLMFERHHDAGAVYIAPYYMSEFPFVATSELTKRVISPDNPMVGSRELYAAMKDLMATD